MIIYRSLVKFAHLLAGVLLLSGCATDRLLMPTPKLYGLGLFSPYGQLDASLKSTVADVLYVTDRSPETTEDGGFGYGTGRSPSLAYGLVKVRIGEDARWDGIAADAQTFERSDELTLEIETIEELGRAPPTPWPYVVVDGLPVNDPAVERKASEVAESFRHALRARLERTPRKEVFIFVHGVANTFSDAAYTMAELWHFFGREGVPVLYSWPAGRGGALRGYSYDRESSEFTIHHMKNALKLITAMPEVEGVHLIAHSRGTDVVSTTFRELVMESRARGEDARKRYRVKNLVLAAPDLDVGVLLQRSASEHVGVFVSRVTIYTSKRDKAIGLAGFLFGSVLRLGQADETVFPERVQRMLEHRTNIALIEYTGTRTGDFGHNYFRTNPAVASDLILTVRYDRDPGEKNGRPLVHKSSAFWEIDDTYLERISQ